MATQVLGFFPMKASVHMLLPLLQDDNKKVRQSAVKTLSKFPQKSLSPLRKVLGNDKWLDKHYKELFELGKSFALWLANEILQRKEAGNTNHLRLFLVILENTLWTPEDEDGLDAPTILIKAIKGKWRGLEEAGEVALQPIFLVLEHGNFEVTEELLQTLTHLAPLTFDRYLKEVSKPEQLYQTENKNRKWMIQLLGRIGDEQAISPLKDLLKNDDRDIRESACDALLTLGWKHNDPVSNHLFKAIQHSLTFGDLTRIDQFLRLIANKKNSPETRKLQMDALVAEYYPTFVGKYESCECGYPNGYPLMTELLDYRIITYEYEEYANHEKIYTCPNCMKVQHYPYKGPNVLLEILQ